MEQHSQVMRRCDICVLSGDPSTEEDGDSAGRQSEFQQEKETVSPFVDNKTLVPPLVPIDVGLIGRCITTQEMQSTVLTMGPGGVVQDPSGLMDLDKDMPHAPGFGLKPMAVLSIPIVSQDDESLGALTVMSKHQSVAPFSVEDSTLLNILATSLSASLVAEQMERGGDE